MRALKCTLIALLALCLMSVPAFASLPEVDADMTSCVLDQANVLSSETENQIYLYNAFLERACDGAQLVVVTVNYLDEDADVAAAKLMNDIGVGSADQSNGMLLLLAAKEARGGVTAGDGIDEAFYDDFSEAYYDDFWDDVDAGRFDDAVQALTGHIYDWYLDHYGVTDNVSSGVSGTPMDDIYDMAPAPARSSGRSAFIGSVGMILLLVLIIWLLGAASRFTRMRRWGYTGGFFPIFWFGGHRRYNDWYRRQPPPPPGPGPGPGPGPRPGPRSTGGSMFRSGGGFHGGGHAGGASRPSGSFRSGGGGFHGGGGHSGGGFRGRR